MAKEVVVEGNTLRVVEVDDNYRESGEFYRDEPKTECIDGVVYAMASGTVQHARVMGKIFRIIGNALDDKPCSVFDGTLEYHYHFNADDETRERDYLQPDIMICCDESKLIGTGYYAAPKFVAEVLIPGTARYDKKKKFDIYEETGVSEYWLVTPNGTIDIYYLEDGHYTLHESIVYIGDPRGKNCNANEEIALRDFPDIKMTLGQIFKQGKV